MGKVCDTDDTVTSDTCLLNLLTRYAFVWYFEYITDVQLDV